MERRLAAIMAADVVGYSRLMEQDEARTLTTLKRRRRAILDPLLAQRRGRVVKTLGDGPLPLPLARARGSERAIRPAGGAVAAGLAGQPDPERPRRLPRVPQVG